MRARSVKRVLGGALALAALGACAPHDCPCSSAPAITIDAPAGAVSDVKLSGPACTGMFPACAMSAAADYPPGCATTMIFARNAGECDVEIDFTDGGVTKRAVTLVARADACCTTIRADDDAGGVIDLTGGAGDAGADAARD